MKSPDAILELLQAVANLNERVLQLVQITEQSASSSESLTYSVEQACKVLGVSRSKLYELLHRPDFPVVSVGQRKLIPRKQLEQWLNQQAQTG